MAAREVYRPRGPLQRRSSSPAVAAKRKPEPLEDLDERQHLALIELAGAANEVAALLIESRVKFQPIPHWNFEPSLQAPLRPNSVKRFEWSIRNGSPRQLANRDF